jgi:ribose transport system permease protein
MTFKTAVQRAAPRDWDLAARIALSALIIVAAAFAIPDFLSVNNSFAVLQVVAPIGIAALGVGVTMLAGEFDLSIGSMAVLGGVISVLLSDSGPLVCIVVPVLVGALLGSAQGYAISRLRVSSLVITIGTLILFRGVAYVLANDASVVMKTFDIGTALNQRLWIFSPMSLVFLGLAVLLWLLLRYTKFGHEVYAVGGGRREAQAAGIAPVRPLVLVFAISGSLGALAGSLVSLSIGGATPTGFGEILLSSIAAAVIGGIALSGGRGSSWGIVLGALALGVISNGVSVLGAPVFVSQFLTGGLLLAALAAEVLSARSNRARAGGSSSAPAPAVSEPAA